MSFENETRREYEARRRVYSQGIDTAGKDRGTETAAAGEALLRGVADEGSWGLPERGACSVKRREEEPWLLRGRFLLGGRDRGGNRRGWVVRVHREEGTYPEEQLEGRGIGRVDQSKASWVLSSREKDKTSEQSAS